MCLSVVKRSILMSLSLCFNTETRRVTRKGGGQRTNFTVDKSLVSKSHRFSEEFTPRFEEKQVASNRFFSALPFSSDQRICKIANSVSRLGERDLVPMTVLIKTRNGRKKKR